MSLGDSFTRAVRRLSNRLIPRPPHDIDTRPPVWFFLYAAAMVDGHNQRTDCSDTQREEIDRQIEGLARRIDTKATEILGIVAVSPVGVGDLVSRMAACWVVHARPHIPRPP
ncbi:hypothetical protein [Nocardia sp. CNY236]|uniref:hypothetical protein n=1 Tax=Nocardia sp. CNY236 TaxID=1169152 RepID=UPI00040F4883|nr:hypothetical protein [Nocardia sp. CNY236]